MFRTAATTRGLVPIRPRPACRSIAISLLVLATATASAAPPTAPSPTPAPEATRLNAAPTTAESGATSLGTLLILGDSIGDPPAGVTSYVDLLSNALKQRFGALQVVRGARGGARARDLAGQISRLPSSLPGPVAAIVTVGGNDLRDAGMFALANADQNRRESAVRAIGSALDALLPPGRFGPGVEIHVWVADIYDPSDGRGGFDQHHCPVPIGRVDTDPIFARWNEALSEAATARGQSLLGLHDAFRGHGFDASDTWYLRDCIHPNQAGHQAIADLLDRQLTAFRPPTNPSAAATGARPPSGDGAKPVVAEPPAPTSTAAATAPVQPPAATAPVPPIPTATAAPTRLSPAPSPAGAPAPSPTPPVAPVVGGRVEGYFEIRLRTGSSFKARWYIDRGDAIEVKRAGLNFTIPRSEIVSIDSLE